MRTIALLLLVGAMHANATITIVEGGAGTTTPIQAWSWSNGVDDDGLGNLSIYLVQNPAISNWTQHYEIVTGLTSISFDASTQTDLDTVTIQCTIIDQIYGNYIAPWNFTFVIPASPNNRTGTYFWTGPHSPWWQRLPSSVASESFRWNGYGASYSQLNGDIHSWRFFAHRLQYTSVPDGNISLKISCEYPNTHVAGRRSRLVACKNNHRRFGLNSRCRRPPFVHTWTGDA